MKVTVSKLPSEPTWTFTADFNLLQDYFNTQEQLDRALKEIEQFKYNQEIQAQQLDEYLNQPDTFSF